MKDFKDVLNYFSEKNYLFEEIGNDIVVFKNVEWKDYYEMSDNNRDIMSVEYDYDYMNRRVYNIILVRNKKVYGNNNMDKLFKNELLKYIGDDKKVLLSEFMNKFNNKSVFGLLYNFRGGRWSVNDYSDRFENWCRRSGMLVKEIINDSSYKRRWLVK
jgi:hypothetical protein